MLLEEKNKNKILIDKINKLEKELQKEKNKIQQNPFEEELNKIKIENENMKKRMNKLEKIIIKDSSTKVNLIAKIEDLNKELQNEKNKNNINNNISQLEKTIKKEKENMSLKLSNLENENHIIKKEKEKLIIEANKLKIEVMNEKNKNKDLITRIKDIEGKSSDKRIISLYQKIDQLRNQLSRYPFELLEGEKIISVLFCSQDQKVNDSIICKNTDIFSEIERKLYKLYPKLTEKEHFFLVKGTKVNRNKSLEFNGISDHDKVILNEIE